eukprot:GHVH01007316.1.p1 GENE.GHVH01007316.1~~GHVH01007316.1.p1  ORF type:complete len:427 (+),score=43.52 GHVH01007316.1:101-1381(+)
MIPVVAVWAQSAVGGISKEGLVPWNVPADLKFYLNTLRPLTNGRKVAQIVGRITYESMGSKPVANSIPIIVSLSVESGPKLCQRTLKNGDVKTWTEYYCSSLKDAIDQASALPEVGMVNISGGSRIYNETVKYGLAHHLWITVFTREDGPFSADNIVTEQPLNHMDKYCCTDVSRTYGSRVPENEVSFCIYSYSLHSMLKVGVNNEISVQKFLNFDKDDENAPPVIECHPQLTGRHHEEFQYLDLITKVMNTGDVQCDRTRVGTKSIFGAEMRFSLADGVFPLLTSKRVFWRGVVEELLWFIRGETNSNTLAEKGVKIWDGNSSREFLDARGLQHREEGDLGPIYGFQWRHYGCKYDTYHTDYSKKGIDQLQDVIDKLKTNPADRRMIVCSWNVSDLDDMALPPCHCLFQFYASGDKVIEPTTRWR